MSLLQAASRRAPSGAALSLTHEVTGSRLRAVSSDGPKSIKTGIGAMIE